MKNGLWEEILKSVNIVVGDISFKGRTCLFIVFVIALSSFMHNLHRKNLKANANGTKNSVRWFFVRARWVVSVIYYVERNKIWLYLYGKYKIYWIVPKAY